MKTIAIVGRTNVGKSTFFNRLAKKKNAIVHDQAGVTRDRKEGVGSLYDLTFNLIDTAGLEETTALSKSMWEQTLMAIDEADIILMLVDARAERTGLDDKLAASLRKLKDKKVFLIANKCEGQGQINALGDFYKLGLGEPIPFSAEHGLGLGDLYAALKPLCPVEEVKEEAPQERPIRLSIVGRPNVGKSTLINKLIGKNRLLTGPEAGVTRDAITLPYQFKGQDILLTDTAGLRKKGKIDNSLEKFSVKDTLESIKYAEVVILVIDANDSLEKQDLLIASHVINEGRALLLAINKWDTIANQKKCLAGIQEQMVESLQQVKGLPVIPVSAKTGFGLNYLMQRVVDLYQIWNKRVPTHKMNTFLKQMVETHPTPMAKNGRRVPMKYMTQVSTRPPTFVIFSSNPDQLPESYLRYLSNGLREQFDLVGVPIRIHMRKRENPFANKAKKS